MSGEMSGDPLPFTRRHERAFLTPSFADLMRWR